MQSLLNFGLYAALLAGIVFLADAVIGFMRAAQGKDDDAVARRLSSPIDEVEEERRLDVVRVQQSGQAWRRYVPFHEQLQRLIDQSGTKMPLDRLFLVVGIIDLAVLVTLVLLLPYEWRWLSIPIGAVAGIGPVLLYLRSARKKRIAKFTEQLPDALDLLVRSLRIGHPLSGAMSVIASELPEPIGPEFGIACEQVTYGHEIAAAIIKIKERVPVADLGYVGVVVQIQQETGGNLVESLAKLSAVIRDRLRMFQKVQSLTVEGRVSAWILSAFPLFIGTVLQLIKPDYFTSVMDYQYFRPLVIATIVLLIVNVFAMRAITTIKV